MFFKKYKNLRTLKPYFTKYKGLIIILIACMVVASSMGLIVAYLMSEQLFSISNELIESMVRFTILIIVGILIHHIAWFYWDKVATIIGNKIAYNLKFDIITNIINTKYKVIKNKPIGYYLERLNDDVEEVSFFVQNVAGTMVDVFTNISFLVVIYLLNWQCGIIFTIGLVVLYVIDLIKINVDLKNTKKTKVLIEEVNSRLTETVRGIKDIKGLGIKNEIEKINAFSNDKLCKQKTIMKISVTLLERVRTFTQWIIDSALVFACAFWLFPTGQIAVVSLLIIFNYKSLMYDTVGFFSKVKNYYVLGDFKASRILEITNNLKNKDSFGVFNIVNCYNNAVEIKNLSFSYDTKTVLQNVSLILPKNTASVLLGASGSGKSTLFSLICKLNECKNNQIFINGTDINSLNEVSLYDNVTIINQEPFIFNDTILNNLKIVKPNATNKEIETACKLANIHDEIIEMKDNYNTTLTENGTNLSGGQKQRLSIARAVLKNCSIMLFDEPTSALDKYNQNLFLKTITNLKKTKTIFIITHKLSSYEAFDQVFELKNGVIKEVKKQLKTWVVFI